KNKIEKSSEVCEKKRKKRRQGPSKQIKVEFQLKSLSSLLPTLQLRKRNQEDLYQITICQKCKEKEESFEHLTACEVDEARWLEKEYLIANQIWLNLDTVVKKKITIEDLYTSLTSEKEADRHRKRNYIARGLIELDLATSLLAMGITRKVADLIITEYGINSTAFYKNGYGFNVVTKLQNGKNK
ncbi:15276_t:CDS:1, partial [Gigaspora margarita]